MEKEQNLVKATCDLTKQVKHQQKIGESESKLREKHAQLCTALQTLDTLTPTHSGLDAAVLLCDGPQTEALVSRASELTAQVLTATKQEYIAQALLAASNGNLAQKYSTFRRLHNTFPD